MDARTSPELVFGPRARELNARALPLPAFHGTRVDSVLARRVACAFRADGPSKAELETLHALPSAELHPHLAAGPHVKDQLVLVADPEELAGLADENETAACLLAAHENLQVAPRRPRLMGVLNVTPDSFSDGGRFLDPGAAVRHGLAMERHGAAILDVGGESTRPGSLPVPTEEEIGRVVPVVADLFSRSDCLLSIDTRKAEVARVAIEAGCRLVNDVSGGLHDPSILDLVAEREVDYVCMHMRGTPETMQSDVRYDDPTAEIVAALRERVAACLKAGIALHKIVLDPGIGFGKRLADNLDVLRRLPELRSLGLPILMGVSRKSFIAHLTRSQDPRDLQGASAEDSPSDRIGGTAAALAACVRGGAEILRVHDVGVMSEAVQMATALFRPDLSAPPPHEA